jgi:AraC family transcriptional regulator
MLDVSRAQQKKLSIFDPAKSKFETRSNQSRNSSIRSFLRGNSTLVFSSGHSCRSGIEIEEHFAPPGERQETTIDGLLLCLWQHQMPLRYDHPNSFGVFVPRLVEPDTFSLYTVGVVEPVRPFSQSHVLMCAFDHGMLQELSEEMRDEGNISSIAADGSIASDQRSFMDTQLHKILLDLIREEKMNDRSEPIFIETLAQALLDRLLTLTHHVVKRRQATGALHRKLLRSIRERIEDDPRARLDLETLSKESGYSRRHLIRLFQTNGRPPHRYILDLRLEKARTLMIKRSFSLIDIAYECGFSSDAHFTRAFRQRFRVTPSAYRQMLIGTHGDNVAPLHR